MPRGTTHYRPRPRSCILPLRHLRRHVLKGSATTVPCCVRPAAGALSAATLMVGVEGLSFPELDELNTPTVTAVGLAKPKSMITPTMKKALETVVTCLARVREWPILGPRSSCSQ